MTVTAVWWDDLTAGQLVGLLAEHTDLDPLRIARLVIDRDVPIVHAEIEKELA